MVHRAGKWKAWPIALLAAALCFALLSSLHVARPIIAGPDYTLSAFSPADICGGEEAHSGRCPSCTLAKAAVTPLLPACLVRHSISARAVRPPLPDLVVLRAPFVRHRARAPPRFT